MTDREIDQRALLTDQTENFLQIGRDGSVRISLRTDTDSVERCTLYTADREHRICAFAGRTEADGFFACHHFNAGMRTDPFLYWFVLECSGRKYFYTRRGLLGIPGFGAQSRPLSQGHPGQIPAGAWYFIPGFDVPAWAEGAVMYQIFTDRFCNGDPGNDVLTGEYVYNGETVSHRDDWYSLPSACDTGTHYGGDLQGVIDKLDYLAGLGVEVLYLNPIFLSPSNHKYDTQDYEHIDPHYGRILSGRADAASDGRTDPLYITRVTALDNLEASDQLFAKLVREAHARGMRVILDGVFNHCGASHRWMDRDGIYLGRDSNAPGAYHRKNSPYHDYFEYTAEDWPDPPAYESWWGFDTLPKLNYENSSRLTEEIMRVAAKWVSPPFNADGWRLDVAADLGHSEQFNHCFWRRFRSAVKRANPDSLILAENYADSATWLGGDEWDGIMNYEGFMEPVGYFLTGMEKHSDSFDPERLGDPDMFWHAHGFLDQECLPQKALAVSMNQLSNHDHARFMTRTNRLVGRLGSPGPDGTPLSSGDAERGIRRAVFMEAAVMQMTLPGAPTLYYGDEAGVCGFTDPDNRRSYPWGREDLELIELHRALIRIRRDHSCLRRGSLVRLADDVNVLSYGRFDRDGICIVAVNNRERSYTLRIPVRYAGVGGHSNMAGKAAGGEGEPSMRVLFVSDREGFDCGGRRRIKVREGVLTIHMKPESSVILAV